MSAGDLAVPVDSLTEGERALLLRSGWRGRPGDRQEALYPPQAVDVPEDFPESLRDRLLDAGWRGLADDGAERLYAPATVEARVDEILGTGYLGTVAAHVGGGQHAIVSDHLVNAVIDLSITEVSQVDLTFYDPTGELRDGPHFRRRTIFYYAGFTMEVAARSMVDVGGRPGLQVTGRFHRSQHLKRLRGPLVRRDLSATEMVRAEARFVGAPFVGQDSPVREQITRGVADQFDGGQDETSWDLCQRLAKEEGFLFFETAETIYFGQPTWLVDRLPKIRMTWTSEDGSRGVPRIQARTAPPSGPAGAPIMAEYENGDALYEGGWLWSAASRTYQRSAPINPAPLTGPGDSRRLSAYEDGSALYEGGWAWDPEGNRFRQGTASAASNQETDYILSVPTVRESDNDEQNGLTAEIEIHPLRGMECIPGRAVDLGGVGVYSRPYLITAMRMDLRGVVPARVSLATPQNAQREGSPAEQEAERERISKLRDEQRKAQEEAEQK